MANSPCPSAHWGTLRACWLDLTDARLQQPDETEFSRGLRQRHSDALAGLVAAGELEADVRDRISVAISEAISHVQRNSVTCYLALPAAYAPRENLTTQAAVLAEMAARAEVDPNTLARAQDALARDIAWLAQFEGGREPWKQESIEASPAETEAARILTDLLVGNK